MVRMIVGGVDTHADQHVAAAIDANGGRHYWSVRRRRHCGPACRRAHRRGGVTPPTSCTTPPPDLQDDRLWTSGSGAWCFAWCELIVARRAFRFEAV